MHDCRCSTLRPIFLIVTPENPISSEKEGGERGAKWSTPSVFGAKRTLLARILFFLRQMMMPHTRRRGKIVPDLHHQMSSLATKKMDEKLFLVLLERKAKKIREMAKLSRMKRTVVQYFTVEKVEEANEQKNVGIAKKSWGVSFVLMLFRRRRRNGFVVLACYFRWENTEHSATLRDRLRTPSSSSDRKRRTSCRIG